MKHCINLFVVTFCHVNYNERLLWEQLNVSVFDFGR